MLRINTFAWQKMRIEREVAEEREREKEIIPSNMRMQSATE